MQRARKKGRIRSCLFGTASPRSSMAAAMADTCSGGKSEQKATCAIRGG